MPLEINKIITKTKKVILAKKNYLFKNKKRSHLSMVLIVVVVILLLGFFKKQWFVAAMVGNRPISRLSVVQELEKQGGAQVLDTLVTEQIILQEAQKQNIIASEETINEEIAQIEAQLVSQGTTLDDALLLQDQTREDVVKSIRIRLLIEELLADKINTSEEKIKAYFEENKDTFPKDTSYEAVKEQVKEQYLQFEYGQKYNQWQAEIKESTNVKYFVTY